LGEVWFLRIYDSSHKLHQELVKGQANVIVSRKVCVERTDVWLTHANKLKIMS